MNLSVPNFLRSMFGEEMVEVQDWSPPIYEIVGDRYEPEELDPENIPDNHQVTTLDDVKPFKYSTNQSNTSVSEDDIIEGVPRYLVKLFRMLLIEARNIDSKR